MGIKITSVLKCTGISVFLTVLFVFIISLLSYFTGAAETTLTIMVYVSVVLSVFLGSLICIRNTDGKALFHALILSAAYYALLVAVTLLINGIITPNSHFFTMTAGIFASGILGAVLGK